jgi:hypothetical protein
VDQEQ